MTAPGQASVAAARELEGKTAILTGATGGIGVAIAAALARQGCDIAAVHRNDAAADSLRDTVTGYGCRFASIHTDLARPAEVNHVVGRTVEVLGRVDILINNAALQIVKPFLEQTVEEWDQVFAVNLRAAFLLTQQAGTRMVEQGKGGRIINMSSSSAFRALGSPPAYTTSKAGLGALTRIAAAAFGQHGILVNAVAPGITVTPFTRSVHGEDFASREPEGPLANLLGRVAQPEDIADVFVFLCSRAGRNITGQVIHASAGAIV